jgi:phosphoribosylaminoimidazole carboxylase
MTKIPLTFFCRVHRLDQFKPNLSSPKMVKTVGILGGGQLGRMLAEAANRLNIKIISLEKGIAAPAKQITAHADHIDGSFKDSNDIAQLAERCDILTIEIEHVDTEMLKNLHGKVAIEPSWETIQTIQDKFRQKRHLESHDIPVAESYLLPANSEAELERVASQFGFPFMIKACKDAYDGRGNFVVKSPSDFSSALSILGNRALYAEKWANFKMELATMVVQTKDGVLSFPVVETIHERSICKLVYAPPRGVSRKVQEKAEVLAKKTISTFKGKGIFAVEMFLLENDELLVNEIAPRPHNSGHYTIEGCPISQYEAHLHAILDLPIPKSRLRLREPTVMLNILGGRKPDSHMRLVEHALTTDGTVHLYGKGDGSFGRKMGHITVTAHSMQEAETSIAPLIQTFNEIEEIETSLVRTQESAPQVAVIMGSDSDLPTMDACILILEKFSIPHEVRITSAHRTPKFMSDFATSAADRGIKVIIAAAGGAAHLPGMVASQTRLPVIGVPVKGSVLDGVDSLHSIVQMPRGVPVATVGIGNSTNAALLAARILGIEDERIAEAVEEYASASREESITKDTKLNELGAKAYLAQVLRKK